MHYHPSQVAVIYQRDDNMFRALDETGKAIFETKITPSEAGEAVDALLTTGMFLRYGKFDFLINPQKVGYISSGGVNSVILRNFDDKDIVSLGTNAGPLHDLAGPSKPFFKVPGEDYIVNYRLMERIFLNGKGNLELVLKGRPNYVCGGPALNEKIVEPLLKSARAAIKAHKNLSSPPPVEKNNDPSTVLDEAERQKLKNLSSTIKESLFGQDHAVDLVTDSILCARAGLKDDNKPVGSFLFLGPTGVGKTELARKLAEAMGMGFKKLDMSEYMEKVAVSRLIGGSPNYVGYQQGGELTNFVKDNPQSVVLFDEIEKAHPDVAKIMLQIMDDARLTDGKANTVDFKNCIIIMTSNLGEEENQKSGIGFNTAALSQRCDPRGDKAVQGFFLPEFVNRLSGMIRFNPLERDVMTRMVDKFINLLQEKIVARDITITLSPEARNYLADKGYDRQFGARPLGRLIDKELKVPLSHAMLFGELAQGGKAHVGFNRSVKKLTFTFNGKSSGNVPGPQPEKNNPGAIKTERPYDPMG